MTEVDSRLLQWASMSTKHEGEDPAAGLQFQQDLLNYKPQWERYNETKAVGAVLRDVSLMANGDSAAVAKTKATMEQNPGILKACMEAMNIKEEAKPKHYILSLLYDLLRQDSSCFNLFEDAMKSGDNFYKPLMQQLSSSQSAVDAYVVDRSAWLLSALVGNSPRFFSEGDVTAFMKAVLDSQKISELGGLEALTNLLKSDVYRPKIWKMSGVPEMIFSFSHESSSPVVYRSLFAVWMLTLDKQIINELSTYSVVKKIKDVLNYSRAEKVVRLCLTVLTKLLTSKGLAEEIVEEGVLETVQQLEYEKWRDAELYDDIRDVADKIQSSVRELSNFGRYERELNTGSLKWGYVHSGKFWQENVMKFEEGNFKVIQSLANLLMQNADNTTLAVACFDLGQFAALHPLGRKTVSKYGVKERVMELMSSTEPDMRDVRREALLCCQKIMLNKWADAQEKSS